MGVCVCVCVCDYELLAMFCGLCVCWSRPWAVLIWLNWPRCYLGVNLYGPKEPCVRCDPYPLYPHLFIMCQVICWFVYIGKNPRFTAFLDSNLHIRLAIVTENELGLAFPPRNLPKNFVHVLFSYHGNKQTNRQANQRRWLHNPSRKLSWG